MAQSLIPKIFGAASIFVIVAGGYYFANEKRTKVTLPESTLTTQANTPETSLDQVTTETTKQVTAAKRTQTAQSVEKKTTDTNNASEGGENADVDADFFVNGVYTSYNNETLEQLSNNLDPRATQMLAMRRQREALETKNYEDAKKKFQISPMANIELEYAPGDQENTMWRYYQDYPTTENLINIVERFKLRLTQITPENVKMALDERVRLLNNVNNEFNAVQVAAQFAEKQTFIGKGAGSHPTASAVLSDLAALRYDYHYEYKNIGQALDYNPKSLHKVYFRYTNTSDLIGLNFLNITKHHQGHELNFIIGEISLEDLIQANLNERESVFLAFF